VKKIFLIPVFIIAVNICRGQQSLSYREVKAVAAPSAGTLYTVTINDRSGQFRWDAASAEPDDSIMCIKLSGFTTGRLKRIIPQGWVNVMDFGAKGNGTANDYAPVQKAIDYAIYHNINVVYFPAGNYLNNTKGWNIWKDNNADGNPEFVNVELRGQSTAYGANLGNEATLIAGYDNSFLVNIERGKGCKINNLNFTGNNVLNYSIYAAFDSSATYVNNKNIRTVPQSPYSGLVLDAFGDGTMGSDRYPGFENYYSGTKGNGGSTDCHFENLAFNGFYVDIFLTPNIATQNDEQHTFNHIWLNNAWAGLIVRQKQSRNIICTDFKAWNSVRTVFMSTGFGNANGECPVIDNLNVAGNIYQLFYMGGSRVSISNVHAESFYKIGYLGGVTAEISNSVFNPADMNYLKLRYPAYILETLCQVVMKNSTLVYYTGPGNKVPLNIYFINTLGSMRFDNCYLSNEASGIGGDGYVTEKIEYRDCQFYNMPGKVTSNPRVYTDQEFYNRGGGSETQFLNWGTEWTTYNPPLGGNFFQTRKSASSFVNYIYFGNRHITVNGNTATCPSEFTNGKYSLAGEVIKAQIGLSPFYFPQIATIDSISKDGTMHLSKLTSFLVSGTYNLFYPVFNYMTVINIGSIKKAGNRAVNVTEEVTGKTVDIGSGVSVFIDGSLFQTMSSSPGTFTVAGKFPEDNERAIIQYCPMNFSESGQTRRSPELAVAARKVLFTNGAFYKNISGTDTAGWTCIKAGITNTAYPPLFMPVFDNNTSPGTGPGNLTIIKTFISTGNAPVNADTIAVPPGHSLMITIDAVNMKSDGKALWTGNKKYAVLSIAGLPLKISPVINSGDIYAGSGLSTATFLLAPLDDTHFVIKCTGELSKTINQKYTYTIIQN
jgi:hypothetical protein